MWSYFSRDPTSQFKYELGEEFSGVFGPSIWRLHAGKNKTSGDAVSIFALDLKTSDESRIELARKCVKRFKTLRHPNVVTYIDELETDKVIYLVTESVTPLNIHLRDDLSNTSSVDFGISWGIHQVVSGIGFLNDANLVHNNVCMSSIFVDCSGEWKIGGLEFMFGGSETPSRTPPQLQVYEPPEISRGGLIAQKQPTARDLWGIGCLLWEVFNGTLSKTTQLKVPGKIPKSVIPSYCELVSANPKSRPSPSKFLQDCKKPGSYLDNEFVKTMIFIGEIDIKEQIEKQRFFEQLSKVLDTFPQSMCQYKILPKLLKAYEFGGAGSGILSPILKLGKYLEEAEYQQTIVPCVVKLFSSPDRATRVKLLQQLDVFAAHLKPKTVNEQIFPSIVQGFMDTNPVVRENTIKAMIHLAPKLGYKQLNEEVMKHFARLQSKDPEGGIRTNTTICLGKIACYLNPQIRQKILISAFTRGVRDPCRPARLSAIQAMAATQKFYTIQDVGTRLMPILVALTVDQDPSIREAVFKVIKCFLANLEKVSENPDLIAEMEKDVTSSDSAAYDDSWAGWAMSLTSKLYKDKKKTPSPGRDSPTKASAPSANSSTRISVKEKVAKPAVVAAKPASVEISSTGLDAGWGDAWEGDDDDDDVDDPPDEFIDAANNPSRNNEPASDADGWGDLDDWGSMDDPVVLPASAGSSHARPDDFKPADPSLPSSSSYSGWDNNSDDDFLPMEESETGPVTANTGEDFFSSALITETKPARTNRPARARPERKPSPQKDQLESKFAEQTVDDDWSSDSWGAFVEPKKEKRLPKSRPMKLGAKKFGQD